MTNVVSAVELRSLLRMAGVSPTPTSPLAAVQPAASLDQNVVAGLGAKGTWSQPGSLEPAWQGLITTLSDPLMQATMHIEGIGGGSYFGGRGGVGAVARTSETEYRLVGGASTESILAEIDMLLPWRGVPDAQPLRQEFSIAELTVVAAIADAYREEQLQACIDRRAARIGGVTRDFAAKQIVAGGAAGDHRWLLSILTGYAPAECVPRPDHLDAGVAALIGRNLVQSNRDALIVTPELQALCSGFENVAPFLALAVHAPWAERETVLFTRGLQNFWSIEFLSGRSGPRARVSRLGARAMEAMLRQHLAPLEEYAAGELPEAPARVATAALPANCPKCGRATKPGKRFCTGCGTALTH